MCTLLKLCTEDVKTTHVPARASFDDHQMEKYFDFLTGLGFLTTHDGECGTTEKGRRFISKARQRL
jgi:predicted transcriptional regulator